MIAQDELERERYEARVKLQRDELSRLLSATEESLEKGRQQGREEEARRQLTRNIQFLERLLRRTPPSPGELSALSLDQLTPMATHLEEEVERAIPSNGAASNAASKE